MLEPTATSGWWWWGVGGGGEALDDDIAQAYTLAKYQAWVSLEVERTAIHAKHTARVLKSVNKLHYAK